MMKLLRPKDRVRSPGARKCARGGEFNSNGRVLFCTEISVTYPHLMTRNLVVKQSNAFPSPFSSPGQETPRFKLEETAGPLSEPARAHGLCARGSGSHLQPRGSLEADRRPQNPGLAWAHRDTPAAPSLAPGREVRLGGRREGKALPASAAARAQGGGQGW